MPRVLQRQRRCDDVDQVAGAARKLLRSAAAEEQQGLGRRGAGSGSGAGSEWCDSVSWGGAAHITVQMVIFKFIDDKDVFQKFYQKKLAQRLISSASASDDSESSMITKLKELSGFDYTNKLMKMFQGELDTWLRLLVGGELM